MDRHLVLFDVGSADELRRRLHSEAERLGVRFAATCPLHAGEPWTPPGPDDADLVPVWHWTGTLVALQRDARRFLNRFVYPLAQTALPSCVAFSFPAGGLEPRPLDVDSRARLDLEDVHSLLRAPVAGGASCERGPCAPPGRDLEAALAGLDPDQRAAALHTDGPARVLAAAGSGKTKTMVARVGALVARGAAPASVLVLAFNTEAAVQLEERLAAEGIPTTRRIAVDAEGVHCATFNAFGHRFQRQVLGHAPEVSSSGALQERLLRAAASTELVSPAAVGTTLDPYDARAVDEAHALDRGLTAWRAELRRPRPADSPRIDAYRSLQADLGIQTFDDQIITTVTSLLADPGARRLVQDRYRYVLVDEFQDVNPAQVALLDVLSRPWRNLFVVGDDDQLIYGWRSAHVSSIVDFGHDLPSAPYSACFTLPTNYRCSREIVSRAEQLVACNRRRAEKTMQARADAPAGAVLFAAASTLGERLAEVAAFLAVERARLECGWQELAVLCRFRSQLAIAGLGLTSWGLPAGPTAAADGLDPEIARQLGDRFRAAAAGGASHRGTVAIVEEAVAGSSDRCPRGSPDLLHAADAARLLAARRPRIPDFLEAWSEHEQRAVEGPAVADGITMATIHATKGREYRAVAVVDFAPSLEALTEDEREEERRVLYVALTRAKERALLTIDLSRGAPHAYLGELARAPDRTAALAARRSVRDLGRQLRSRRPSLPAPLRAVLDGTAAERPPARAAEPTAGSGATTPPAMDRDTAAVAADYLASRSALTERRVFGRRRLAAVITEWARSS